MTATGINERTLLLVKPDGVLRGLIGEILGRFERVGLAVIGLKLISIPREQAEQHYAEDPVWLVNLGGKTLKTYKKHGHDPLAELGTDDPATIGRMIRGWLIEYLITAPVVACVLQGPHAVEVVRKLAGETMPSDAAPGTIRGDFSTASAVAANSLRTAVRNVVHASSSVEEAEREIATWFEPIEISTYQPLTWTAQWGGGAADGKTGAEPKA